MLLLILGVALWSAAHLFKRVAPGLRQPLGNAGKGIAALLLVASLVMMVLGYRQAESSRSIRRRRASGTRTTS